MTIIQDAKGIAEILMQDDDLEALVSTIAKCTSLKGDFVEVGVYQGGTAYIINYFKDNKSLYLFDTFTGIPDNIINGIDSSEYSPNVHSANYFDVVNRLHKLERVYIFPGYANNNFKYINDKAFSFVHIDVDIFWSTLESIIFFYPRLVKNGIILVHDKDMDGVKAALKSAPFNIKYESVGINYCLIIKDD
jgi:O-methyltransferase